ncbi:MAG: aminotransferase class I/II-fold pyridoxal phosphate-dependent enzyme [Oscillospiraceae bacterium]|nr:aminotransferase class I/II-fold pyridoxal phosphate-dependent enzyme [Oscillospiraceae bacterium]
MKYDFESVIDRRGMDALAVDALGSGWAPDAPKEGFDAIPMWVADMNFATVPTVVEALMARASHPMFGYFGAREEYFSSIIRWQKERHGTEGLEAKHIGFENGVLGGILSALGVYCSRGDNVLLLSPTYMGFTKCISNAGYRIVESPLKADENGIRRIDFEDVARRLAGGHIHAAVFCSPHNPTGRVWEKWEIERFMELCKAYDVGVVSDEIWSDIILPGHRHIPTQSVSEDAKMRTVAMYAPSKTFNLAGLVGAYHIIYNDTLHDRVKKESSLSHYNEGNVLSMHALLGAYRDEGYEWVDELCTVIERNVDAAMAYFETLSPLIRVSRPQGTYMLFLDCGAWLEEKGKTLDELLKMGWDVGVAWQDGRQHGGAQHIRLNLALPLSRVQEALARMDKYVFTK